jgi:hypothetical protein
MRVQPGHDLSAFFHLVIVFVIGRDQSSARRRSLSRLGGFL